MSLVGGPPARPARLRPGQVMHGQYTIVRELGRGGMGAVYLATETIANKQRHVVIKEMLDYYDPTDPQGEAKARARFEAEAGTLVTLNFAGIPQIFGYFSEGGRNYIVMQFIPGRNLQAGLTHEDDNGNLVPGQPYPPDKVRQWGVQLCKVLENLAAQNIVHMDIKPANLIFDNSDNVWLVDFGTAKAQWVAQPGGRVGMQKSSIYGTAGYAPPEQYKGQAEPRSDVYALAATLYHLLTDDDPRDHPFQFPQLGQLPASLAAALRPALEQNASQRITAAQFRQLLDVRPAAGPVFRWQDGTVSSEPRDLVGAADRLWAEARGYFTGGQWEKWFSDRHDNNALAQIAQAKKQSANADIALDAFLRMLDPALPPPRLQVSLPGASHLDFGAVPWQTQRTLDLEIQNAGSGCLHGQFTNLPAWLRVSNVEFAAHDKQIVKITVDAGHLSPAAQPYTAGVTIDAGAGGQARIAVTVTVPEPQLEISSQTLDLGSAYQGETLSKTFTVRNTGGSAFEGTVSCSAKWATIQPTQFNCGPGQSAPIEIKANTSQVGLGKHEAQVDIQARSNQWTRSADVQVVVHLPWLKTFWQRWAKTLDWAAVGMVISLTLFLLVRIDWLHYGLAYRYQFGPTGTQFAIAASIAIVGGWLGILTNFKKVKIGAGFWIGGFLLPWLYNAPAAIAGSLLPYISAGLSYMADFTLGLAQSVALAGIIGAIWQAILHPPECFTKSHPKSGLFAGITCAFALVGMIYLTIQPQYWWRQVRMLQGHTKPVTSVAFSPDGAMLASVALDKTVRLWRVSDGALLRTLRGHTVVYSVAFSPDGATLASGANDGTVRLWWVGH